MALHRLQRVSRIPLGSRHVTVWPQWPYDETRSAKPVGDPKFRWPPNAPKEHEPGAVMTQDEVEQLRKTIYSKIWEDLQFCCDTSSCFFCPMCSQDTVADSVLERNKCRASLGFQSLRVCQVVGIELHVAGSHGHTVWSGDPWNCHLSRQVAGSLFSDAFSPSKCST